MGRKTTAKVTAICHVCGDKASHHKHYGCNAEICFSCRAFFRRCVKKNKIPEKILCNSFLVEAGTCQIKPNTRSICRYVCMFENHKKVSHLNFGAIATFQNFFKYLNFLFKKYLVKMIGDLRFVTTYVNKL